MKRALLVLAAAGLLSLLTVAAPALSLNSYRPEAVDFELAAPAAPATAAGGEIVSKEIRAPKRFNLVGFRWAGGGEPAIELRTRRSGDGWTRWEEVPAHAEHGPDPDGREPGGAGASDGVWVGEADYLQYRLSKRLRGLRMHFVNTTGTATRADRLRTRLRRTLHSGLVKIAAMAGANAQSAQPEIVPRSAWGASQCPPRRSPTYSEVKAAFVHHTVSLNDYSPEEAPSIVLAICRYHRNSNGWDDVGYNFLVDRYGRIYEGRAGGIDRAVMGAQAQGFNAQSTGISVIGNHQPTRSNPAAPPTEQTIDAVSRLIKWKLPLHGQPTTGSVQLTSAGGGSNRFAPGTVVTLQRIVGHRDGNHTACPGDLLYNRLPDIRARVGDAQTSAPQPARLTISRDYARLPVKQLVRFSGSIDPPKSTVYLRVERKVRGRYQRIISVPFRSRDGVLRTRFRPEHRALYRFRFVFLGDGSTATSLSPRVFVRTTKPTGGTVASGR
jgi:N-acetylmuramoyl-L-alanine amidase